MKFRQLQKAAVKSLAIAKSAKNRFHMLSDQAKAAKELVKAVKIKFKVTRKALKQARKNARLSLSDKKQARKELEKAIALADKFQKRLDKTDKRNSKPKKQKQAAAPKIKITAARAGSQSKKSRAHQKPTGKVQSPVRIKTRNLQPKVNKFIASSETVPLEQGYISNPPSTFDSSEKAI